MIRKTPKKPAPVRRSPRQDRSRRTRALIFETAVRILEEEGLEALTTNHLAARSGFSVGTLYQYFRNKEDILRALAHEEGERRLGQVRAALAHTHLPGARIEADPVRQVVRIVLDAFEGRHRARKILIERALRGGDSAGTGAGRPLLAFARLLEAGHSGDAGGDALSEIEAFTLTHAVSGVIRAALARDPALLEAPALEDALVRLARGFLAPPERFNPPLPVGRGRG